MQKKEWKNRRKGKKRNQNLSLSSLNFCFFFFFFFILVHVIEYVCFIQYYRIGIAKHVCYSLFNVQRWYIFHLCVKISAPNMRFHLGFFKCIRWPINQYSISMESRIFSELLQSSNFDSNTAMIYAIISRYNKFSVSYSAREQRMDHQKRANAKILPTIHYSFEKWRRKNIEKQERNKKNKNRFLYYCLYCIVSVHEFCIGATTYSEFSKQIENGYGEVSFLSFFCSRPHSQIIFFILYPKKNGKNDLKQIFSL